MSATILFGYLIIYESLWHKNWSISPFSNMHFWIWISCHQMAKLFFYSKFLACGSLYLLDLLSRLDLHSHHKSSFLFWISYNCILWICCNSFWISTLCHYSRVLLLHHSGRFCLILSKIYDVILTVWIKKIGIGCM